MFQDGEIYRINYLDNGENNTSIGSIVDLEGQPVPIANQSQRITTNPLRSNSGFTVFSGRPFYAVERYYSRLPGGIAGIERFYVYSQNQILIYDRESSRLLGHLGLDGFTGNISDSTNRFQGTPLPPEFFHGTQTTLAFPGAVFSVKAGFNESNEPAHEIAPLIPLESGETLLDGRTILMHVYDSVYGLPEYYNGNYAAFLTSARVLVLNATGEELLSVALPEISGGFHVRPYVLDNPERIALWFQPTSQSFEQPDIVRYYSLNDQQLIQETSLEQIDNPQSPGEPAPPLFTVLAPPALSLTIPALETSSDFRASYWMSIAGTMIISSALVFLLSRRLQFGRSKTLTWWIVGLVFGYSAVLAILCLHKWPYRVPCHSCQKRRLVNRENCEHCGSSFPAPNRDGTEIFAEA